MKKMNYSNFDDIVEVVPASSVEIMDVKQNNTLPAVSVQAAGGTVANAINPMNAIVSLVNTALITVSDIGKCIAMVSIEKQRTKQVEAQARMQIEESIQQTKRIKIQEKESTKRLIIECKANLASKEYELKMLREINRSRENELTQNHKLYIEQLDNLKKIVENVMNDKNLIYQLVLSMDDNNQNLEFLLHSLNNINDKLVDLSKEIIKLKKG